MPRFSVTDRVLTPELSVLRVCCDGCDAPRLQEEAADTDRVWLVTAGAFELRDAARRRMLDPSTMMVFPRGYRFTVRHPCGEDVCLSFRGPLVEALTADGASGHTPLAGAHLRLLAELASWRRGDGDELALAEAFCAAVQPVRRPGAPAEPAPARDRALAEALGYQLRLHHTESTPLAELADRVGVSVFHACRVFRRVTGRAMHEVRSELRLRHALALLLDSRRELAEISAMTGFASQSHLSNRFRARFGVTLAAARRDPASLRG